MKVIKLNEAGNSKIKLSTGDLVVTFYNGKPIVEYEFDYLAPNEQFIIFDMIIMVMDRFLGRHLADISIMDGGKLIFTPITRQNLEFRDFEFQDGTLLSNQFNNEKQFEPIKTNIESYVNAPELSARIAKKFPSKYQAYVPQQFTAGVLIPPRNTQYIKEIIFDIAPANGDKQFRQVISREYTKELPTDLARTNFLIVLQSNAANKQLKYAIGITDTIDINQAIYFEDVGETPDFIKALHDCKHTAEKSGIYNLLSNITWKTVLLEIPETEAIAKAQKAPIYKRSAGFVKKGSRGITEDVDSAQTKFYISSPKHADDTIGKFSVSSIDSSTKHISSVSDARAIDNYLKTHDYVQTGKAISRLVGYISTNNPMVFDSADEALYCIRVYAQLSRMWHEFYSKSKAANMHDYADKIVCRTFCIQERNTATNEIVNTYNLSKNDLYDPSIFARSAGFVKKTRQ